MKKFLFGVLALSCLLGSPALAQYSKFEPAMQQFFKESQLIGYHIDNYNYKQAYQHFNNLLILHKRALGYAAKSETDSPEEVWQINLAFQLTVLRAAISLGQRFHDAKNYQDAIAVYTKAQEISPYFPLLYYERGFAHYKLGQSAQAAADFYEAKRLNAYPAKRKIVSQIGEGDFLEGNPQQIEINSTTHLLNLGLPVHFPLAHDPVSKKPTPLRVMPGVGAHLQLGGKSKAVYLGMSEEQFTQGFVQPLKKSDAYEQNGKLAYSLQFDKWLAEFYEHDVLRSLDIRLPGAHVSMLGKTTRLGDHAKQVLAHFGKSYGYAKFANEGTGYEDVKEFIAYSEFGLIFGISADDHVNLISIYALDDDLLHSDLRVDAHLLKPELRESVLSEMSR